MSGQIGKLTPKVPLRLVLVVPFLLQIFVAVGLTGWLSWRNGQLAVKKIATQLSGQVSTHIEKHVISYTNLAHVVLASSEIALESGNFNLEDLPRLQSYFWQQVQITEDINSLYFGSENGDFLMVIQEDPAKAYILDQSQDPLRKIYNLDSEGNITDFVRDNEYDPRQRPWYQEAKQEGKATWSPIYTFAASPQLGITPVRPLYNSQGELQGVLGIDFTLSQISEFLSNLKISSMGQAFIIERSGALVASSFKEHLGVVEDNNKNQHSQEYCSDNQENEDQRLQVNCSGNSLIAATGKYLEEQFGNFERIQDTQQLNFRHDGQLQFVQVSPVQDGRGLDWLMVIVIPEADFTQEIEQNSRNTILLCLVALLAATLLGMFTSRGISKPVLRLSEASSAIAGGNLEQEVPLGSIYPWLPRIRELTVLANSFNQMSQQLQQSHHQLENYSRSLEIQVKARTRELQQEIEDRELLEEKLRSSESEIRGFFEAMADVIFLVNRSGEEIQVAPTQVAPVVASHINLTLEQFIQPETKEIFLNQVRNALVSGKLISFEYSLLVEGNLVWFAANISPMNEDKVIWVARNITNRKQTELALAQSQRTLATLMSNLPGMAYRCRSWGERKMQFVSEGCYDLTGYHPEYLLDKYFSYIQLIHPEDRESARQKIQTSLSNQQHFQLQYRILTATQQIKWVWEQGHGIFNSEGNLQFIEGLITDVTERYQAEQAVKLILNITQQIHEAPDFPTALGVALEQICQTTQWHYGEAWIPTADGTALECSPTWYFNTKGLAPETITTLETFRSYSEGLTLLPDEGLPGKVWLYQQPEWIADVATASDAVFLREQLARNCGIKEAFGVPIIAKDTEKRLEESPHSQVLAVLVFWILDARPQDQRWVELVTAVAAQLGTVMQQKQGSAQMRALFAAMTDVILVLDSQGRYLKVAPTNPKLLYREASELVGKTLQDVFSPEQATRFIQYIWRALREQQTIQAEYCLTMEDKEVWFDGSIAPMDEETVIWVARDITDRKLAEQSLRLEQQKSENLLLNILPEAIAEKLKQNQSAIAQHFDGVTILFADIVGFTHLASYLQPIELVNLLNQVFSKFDALAADLGLEKIKTIGDAYMVAAGLPLPRSDHAEAIAEMALQMQDAIGTFQSPLGQPLRLRIGINTGIVVAGVIGTHRFIYDLWGDAVNIASRMESQGLPGAIQVTQATYELLQHRYLFDKRGPIAVKGKGKMVTYWLRNRKF